MLIKKIYQIINIFTMMFVYHYVIIPFHPQYLPRHAPLILQSGGCRGGGCRGPKPTLFLYSNIIRVTFHQKLIACCDEIPQFLKTEEGLLLLVVDGKLSEKSNDLIENLNLKFQLSGKGLNWEYHI